MAAAARRPSLALAAAVAVALVAAPRAAAQASDGFLLGCATGAPECADVLAAQPPPAWVAHLDTTAGRVSIAVNTSWAPAMAQRFYALTLLGYGVGGPAFRVLNLGPSQRFVAQLGVRGAPEVDDGERAGRGVQVHVRWRDSSVRGRGSHTDGRARARHPCPAASCSSLAPARAAWENNLTVNTTAPLPPGVSNARGTVAFATNEVPNDGSNPACTGSLCSVGFSVEVRVGWWARGPSRSGAVAVVCCRAAPPRETHGGGADAVARAAPLPSPRTHTHARTRAVVREPGGQRPALGPVRLFAVWGAGRRQPGGRGRVVRG
jgi:cyclophilin family peptidyl-prolyl cis-trans isomerase